MIQPVPVHRLNPSGGFSGSSSLLVRIHDGHCWAVVVNTRPSDQARYYRELDALPGKIKRVAQSGWNEQDLFQSGLPPRQ